MLMKAVIFCAVLTSGMAVMEEFYRWKTISYTNVPDEAFDESYFNKYVPENNLPNGAVHYNGRVFITVPRRRIGVLSSLNYIDIDDKPSINKTGPPLKPYPDYETNKLDSLEPNPDRIISILRPKIDECGRLWFTDSGEVSSHLPSGKQVNEPSIWIIDLETNKRLRRFEMPDSKGNGYASITVDTQVGSCDDAFAYIPDLVRRLLSVYSFRENKMWTFSHNYFSYDPLQGDLNLNGIKFQWDDGIFSVALGPRQKDGYRIAYFHPMISNNEFAVNTRVLQNQTLSQRAYHNDDFKLLGYRGANKQSTIHVLDPRSRIMLYAEIGRNAFGCWNTNLSFSEGNHDSMGQDDVRMFYPTDISVSIMTIISDHN